MSNSLNNEVKAWLFLKQVFSVQIKSHLDAGMNEDVKLLLQESKKPFLGTQKRNAINYRQREFKILTFMMEIARMVFEFSTMKIEDVKAKVDAWPEDPVNRKFYFQQCIIPMMQQVLNDKAKLAE